MPGNNVGGKMKMKSISVGDLGTIVKQMITEALEDTEQMAKLHRAIYDELYFEKMMEFKGVTVDKNSTGNSSEKTSKSELSQNINDCNEFPIADCTRKSSDDCCLSGQGDNCVSQKIVNESVEKAINKNEDYLKPEEAAITNMHKQLSRGCLEKKDSQRNFEAYENWRNKKTRVIKMMLKEERLQRQDQLVAKQEEIDRKKAIHEAYLRSKKLHDSKLVETQRRTMRENYLRMQEEESARIMANAEAFKSWLKRKNSESSQKCCQPQKYQPQTVKTRYSSKMEFNSWLDQLDSVLHQKYLRERRHRVRSFYCQPTYYGTAALYMQ